MAPCTASQALSAFLWWEGYHEKADGTASYLVRDKAVFDANAGSNNYTYAGKLFGCNGPSGAWCAMMDSLAILEACGGDWSKAKTAMWGRFPHYNCGTIFDDANAAGCAHYSKAKGGSYTPVPGDLIVFTGNGTSRDHTGMVCSVSGGYVYTIEGNSSNMCRKRSYLLTSGYIYGYCTPVYDAGGDSAGVAGEQYGEKLDDVYGLHELSKGCAGPEVKTVQRIIYARGIDKTMAVDGDFGKATKAGVVAMQKQLFPDSQSDWDGVVGKRTWAAMLTDLA